MTADDILSVCSLARVGRTTGGGGGGGGGSPPTTPPCDSSSWQYWPVGVEGATVLVDDMIAVVSSQHSLSDRSFSGGGQSIKVHSADMGNPPS